MGVWGQSPWSVGKRAKPPEADRILAFERLKKSANLPSCLYSAMSVHYTKLHLFVMCVS